MCGIVGYWNRENSADELVVENMARRIQTRGPDDAGTWRNEQGDLAFGHRRLSVIDVSAAGRQPMTSPCGRFVLTYNGELYNHMDLRAELETEGGHFNWRGHSDTETLLAALRHWGVERALRRLNGMFAFALWDAHDRTMFLARDRLGEKPLYYGNAGEVFLFSSELKALAGNPHWSGKIDRDSLSLFFRYNYVPTPRSIYQGILKLPPAHYVVVRNGGRDVGDPVRYWDIDKIVKNGCENTSSDAASLTDELDALLQDSVGRRMVADVPLGAFLSGGYDSTTVTAIMQAQSRSPVQTFSIGFHEEAYNEAERAAEVARYLGTNHTELYVSSAQAMDVIPQLPIIYDEPFSDVSQIPTYLISKLARQHVKVSLSGDGGDELFYGYNRYVMGYRIWQKLRLVPGPLRNVLGWALKNAPGDMLDALQRRLPQRMQVSSLADRLPKLAEVFAHREGWSIYRDLLSHWKSPDDIVIGGNEPDSLMSQPDRMPEFPSLREQMMYVDMLAYLPDDILTKVDRASMAVSLETRMPLLDHRLVEFAWRVPMHFKFRDGQGKWLLRQVLYRYVPQHLMDRPKMGFGVPIDQWLRGPLREWADALLDEKRLREEGFLDPIPIRKLWDEHVSGARRWHSCIWDVLMFQAWLDAKEV